MNTAWQQEALSWPFLLSANIKGNWNAGFHGSAYRRLGHCCEIYVYTYTTFLLEWNIRKTWGPFHHYKRYIWKTIAIRFISIHNGITCKHIMASLQCSAVCNVYCKIINQVQLSNVNWIHQLLQIVSPLSDRKSINIFKNWKTLQSYQKTVYFFYWEMASFFY